MNRNSGRNTKKWKSRAKTSTDQRRFKAANAATGANQTELLDNNENHEPKPANDDDDDLVIQDIDGSNDDAIQEDSIMDIEDLIDVAKDEKGCPYYAARVTANDAQVSALKMCQKDSNTNKPK